MIITCNQCESSFSIDDRLIKRTGSKVKCSKCSHLFVAYPPSVAEEVVAAPVAAGSTTMGSGSDESELKFDVEDDRSESAAPETQYGRPSAGSELEIGLADLKLDEDVSAPDELSFEEFSGDEDNSAATDAGFAEVSEGAEADELRIGDLEDLLEEATDSSAEEAGSGESGLDSAFEIEAKAGDVAALKGSDNGLDQLDFADLENMLDQDEAPHATEQRSEDLDLDLDLAEEAAPKESAAASAKSNEDLDFSDLADILETDEAPAAVEASDLESEELGLDLEAGEAPAAEPAEAAGGDAGEDLDFSDLADILETDEAPAAAEASDVESEELNLDLDLEEAKEAKPAEAGAVDQNQDLDFSDLEDILVTEESVDAAGAADDASPDLQLDLDLDLDLEGDQEAAVSPGASGAAAEDDFLDIEKMLEESSDTGGGQSSDTAAGVQGSGAGTQSSEDEFELEFDLDGVPQDRGAASFSTEDELELQLIDGDSDTSHAESDEAFQTTGAGAAKAAGDSEDFATDEFTAGSDLYGETDVIGAGESANVLAEPVARPVRKRSSKTPILVLLVIVVLAVGVLIIPKSLGIHIPYVSDLKIPYISDVNLKIPYLSDLMSQKNKDLAGNIRMVPLEKTVNGRFVSNPKTGQLFVIEGKVQNAYSEARSFVKVTGKLFQKGGVLAGSSTVFCGNVLSPEELGSMDLSTMNSRLQNSFGEHKSNLKINAGSMVPFMIVFANLPNNLDEYTVEVAGSANGQDR
jgi:pilus assembly protein FimV